MRPDTDPAVPQPYWTLHHALGEVDIVGQHIPVFLKAHISHEHYSEPASINPLGLPEGERDYLLAHLYMSVPDLQFTVDLASTPAGGAMGTVVDVADHGVREERIGSGQAWYYPAARTVVLWELLLKDGVRTADLEADHSMRTLWQGFERFLVEQFPDTQQIMTPSWDPDYETHTWQRFLGTLGYGPSPSDEQAFWKPY